MVILFLKEYLVKKNIVRKVSKGKVVSCLLGYEGLESVKVFVGFLCYFVYQLFFFFTFIFQNVCQGIELFIDLNQSFVDEQSFGGQEVGRKDIRGQCRVQYIFFNVFEGVFCNWRRKFLGKFGFLGGREIGVWICYILYYFVKRQR